jgi:hypothetical protein
MICDEKAEENCPFALTMAHFHLSPVSLSGLKGTNAPTVKDIWMKFNLKVSIDQSLTH